jgi:NAD(P)H dehydrogenase (quinone)
MEKSAKIVVTAASGRLGRSVAVALARLGVADRVTLASREPAALADLKSLGFHTTRADYGDADSLLAALDGAATLLMISMPGPVEARIPRHRKVFDAAKEAGVGRTVYTSRVNPSETSLYPFAPIHAISEAYIRSIELPATIVRNNEYSENVVKLIGGSTDPNLLMLPGATGMVPYIAVTEIAEVLANLLVQEGHEGKTYELSGPQAIGRDEIAEVVARASGRPVIAAPISGEEFGAFMQAQGRPPFIVEMVKGLHAAIDAGEFAKIWPDAEQLLGRPTTAISDYLTKAFTPR